jgi:two-component system, chemotaxis family, chemotaxis protein CheY
MSRILENLSVLLIEDEAHIRAIIRQILYRIGIRSIYECEEGGKGLMETLRVKPTVVLCDIHMKPVNGLTYLANLRKVQVGDVACTPVVFLTADAERDTVLLAKDLRVDGYLVKPVSLIDVKKQLSRVLKTTIE